MAIGKGPQPAEGLHQAPLRRQSSAFEQSIGRLPHRGDNDYRPSIQKLLDDPDDPSNRRGILHRTPAKLHDDHVDLPTPPEQQKRVSRDDLC